MKDFIGQELKIGDKIIYNPIGYRELAIGTVKRLGSKKVTIETDKYDVYQFYYQIIKHPNQ